MLTVILIKMSLTYFECCESPETIVNIQGYIFNHLSVSRIHYSIYFSPKKIHKQRGYSFFIQLLFKTKLYI